MALYKTIHTLKEKATYSTLKCFLGCSSEEPVIDSMYVEPYIEVPLSEKNSNRINLLSQEP